MALIELADTLGCSIRDISQHVDAEELELRLAYHLMKIGFTSDQEKIQKQRKDAFLAEARNANWQ